MMTRPRISACAALATTLLSGAPVLADSTVTLDDDTVVQIRNGMVRMIPAGEASYMVYDAGRNLLIHVDPAEGSYMEMDEQFMQRQAEALGAMREQMAAQMEAMRSQMQNLPEDQRRMMEQSMGAMVGGQAGDQAADKPELKTVKKGSRTVKGFKCNDYQVLEDKTPVADLCVAEKAGAGMSADDFATLSAMMAFLRSMAEQASEMVGSMADGFDAAMLSDVDGFPVEVKDHSSNEHYGVASVSNGPLGDALFNEYKKLRKEEMPDMSGR